MNFHTAFLYENECYKRGMKRPPQGVMVHSTGANNPYLKRYIGPDDGKLGKNIAGNHWNQLRPDGRQVCVHAFVGKLENGEIATYQTLPWNFAGWHCAGAANGTHIGFEICEDSLADPEYFKKVYREAVEFTAYLCKMFSLDPMKDGVILCHSEGFKRGLTSNHGDVMHWFPKFGKNMTDFRWEVREILEGEEMTREEIAALVDNRVKEILTGNGTSPEEWAKNSMLSMRSAGITDGTRPGGYATRQEVFVMLDKARQNILDRFMKTV